MIGILSFPGAFGANNRGFLGQRNGPEKRQAKSVREYRQ
jgi:hypothetical protein